MQSCVAMSYLPGFKSQSKFSTLRNTECKPHCKKRRKKYIPVFSLHLILVLHHYYLPEKFLEADACKNRIRWAWIDRLLLNEIMKNSSNCSIYLCMYIFR